MSNRESNSRTRSIQGPKVGGIRTLLHLIMLWSFAVAQPLYSKIADNVPFLLAHRLDSVELVAYTLGILLVAPLVLWAVLALSARLWRAFGAVLQRTTITVLLAMALFPILEGLGLAELLALVISFAIGLMPALLYHGRFWPSLFDILTPAPLLFAAVFLFFSPVQALLPGGEARSEQGTQDDRDIPVVILMLDELSTQALLNARGELDRSRLPGFARLADISTWYPRATTVVEATVMAAPVILSGILPEKDRHQPPVYQNFPENLFDQVSAERRIWAVENGSRLCRPQRCETADVLKTLDSRLGRWQRMGTDTAIIYGHMVLPDGLRERWLPEFGTRWAGFAGERDDRPEAREGAEPRKIRWGLRHAEFNAFLKEIGRVGPDTLHYLHLLMPHAPWIYLPDGQAYDINRSDSINGMMPDSANDTGIKHMWWNDRWATVIGEQRFLLQTHYVDKLVGDLVDRLSASEHFEQTMLIVVADHGGSFTPGTSRRALTEDNFAEILPIPLFIKYPGQLAGERSNRPAELLDISPTIRKALGIDISGLDGKPLQAPDSRPFRPRLVNEHLKHFEFSEAEYEREFRRIVQRMHRRFSFSDSDRFVRIGQWADAYGQPIASIGEIGPEAAELVFALDSTAQWQEYSPEGPIVPARLLGRLRGDHESIAGMLVTLNDRVAGFTRPFDYPGSDGRVEAMLWPELLESGTNELAVYVVAEVEPRILLREIPLVESNDAEPNERPVAETADPAGRLPLGDSALLGKWFFPASLGPGEGVELRGDWYAGGSDIRWVGRQASVCFELDDGQHPMKLEFHATPFLHEPALEQQRLLVEIDGQSITEISMDEQQFKAYRVEFQAPVTAGNQPLCIDFGFPDARIPRDLGTSSDRRVLGAAFLKFRLVAQQ